MPSLRPRRRSAISPPACRARRDTPGPTRRTRRDRRVALVPAMLARCAASLGVGWQECLCSRDATTRRLSPSSRSDSLGEVVRIVLICVERRPSRATLPCGADAPAPATADSEQALRGAQAATSHNWTGDPPKGRRDGGKTYRRDTRRSDLDRRRRSRVVLWSAFTGSLEHALAAHRPLQRWLLGQRLRTARNRSSRHDRAT